MGFRIYLRSRSKTETGAKKAETESTNARTEAMRQILSEPTQMPNLGGGIDTKTAIAVGVIVVVGLIVGYKMINKKKAGKQAAVQESPLVVDQIV